MVRTRVFCDVGHAIQVMFQFVDVLALYDLRALPKAGKAFRSVRVACAWPQVRKHTGGSVIPLTGVVAAAIAMRSCKTVDTYGAAHKECPFAWVLICDLLSVAGESDCTF